jgi:hypothetical protein
MKYYQIKCSWKHDSNKGERYGKKDKRALQMEKRRYIQKT